MAATTDPLNEPRALHLSLKRYELRRMLGRGGSGVVYEAFDRTTGAIVALKALKASAAEGLDRLKREFRVLASVQHPNLVRFGELFCEEGQWYFTLELVRGTGFLDYVSPKARGAFDETRLRSTLTQLVSVVAAIHQAGFVHRDLKSQNVLISNEGRLVLFDFDLVTALKPNEVGSASLSIVGTPAAMAPEQAGGQIGGPASDWYAVGVMLFSALTGRLPFEGSVVEVLEAKLVGEAPSPRQFAPGLPDDLADLCSDLLQSAPELRPKAGEIIRRLGHAHASTPQPDPIEPEPPSTVFVARERELEALHSAFAELKAGRGRVVIVEGEPGFGKSALVQRFLAAASSPAVVLSGRCYEQESIPFKGVDDLIDSLTDALEPRSDDEISAILVGGVRYLAAVFPTLGRLWPVQAILSEGRHVENEQALREQAFNEFSRILAALAQRGPVILFIDDLQWADADSLAILHHILSPQDRVPCLFVATLRAGIDLAPRARELCALGQTITLDRLSDDESTLLWDALSNATPELSPLHNPTTNSARPRDIAIREAGGNPLFLAELVRLHQSGGLNPQTGARLKDVLTIRVLQRDPLEQRFLEMVAIAGEPLPYEVVAKAAGLEVGECLMRLAGLRAAQLLRVTRRGETRLVEPHHDRVREAILSHITSSPAGLLALAQQHLALGRALKANAHGDTLRLQVFAVLQHLDAARRLLADEKERLETAALHLLAGREARLATAYERAGHHAREGLTLAEGSGESSALTRDLWIEQMAADYLAGHLDAARRSFEIARARVAPGDDRTALFVTWIGLETGRRRLSGAIAAGCESLRELGVRVPMRGRKWAMMLAYAATRRALKGRALSDLSRLAPVRDPVRARQIALTTALGSAAFWADKNLLAWLTFRVVADGMKYGFTESSPANLSAYGMILAAAFGKYAEGAEFGRLALLLQERFGSSQALPKIYFLNGAFLTAWVQPFDEALALLRLSHDHALKHGDTVYQGFAAGLLPVFSFCASAPLAAVQSLSVAGGELFARLGNQATADASKVLAHHAAVLQGLPFQALERTVDAKVVQDDGDVTTFMAPLCSAERAYLTGDPENAWGYIQEAKRHSGTSFGLPTLVELSLLEVLIAAQQYDRASLWTRFRLRRVVAKGVRKLEGWAHGCPSNYDPHHLLGRAELARITGRAAQSAADLDRAVVAARAHSAPKREAMALELKAALVLRSGEVLQAQQLRQEASDAYRRWGAVTKAEALIGLGCPP